MKIRREFSSALLVALTLLVAIGGAGTDRALAQTQLVPQRAAPHGGTVEVPLNKSQVIRIDQPFRELRLGNEDIADVIPLTERSVYVLGKQVGTTSLAIFGGGGRLISVVDIGVTYDAPGLRAKLAEVVPGERVEVRAVNNAIILSGTVSDTRQIARVISVAETFAPEGGIRNLMRVSGSQQVMLEVRFAEMNRDVAKRLGINWDVVAQTGNFIFGLATGLPTTSAGVPFFPLTSLATGPNSIVTRNQNTNSLIGQFNNGTVDLTGVIDLLEQQDMLKVLAEPNLIALSGESARFLAGGEFPVPVAQDEDTVTIAFKEFGVGLAFTPTVLDDGLINLVVAPEVSQIDTQTSITTLQGASIPGLTTRKAETTIELRDGQSFAIAGLLQSDLSNQVRDIPWLGDVPVLGALFRSTQFQRNETELVIIVTPRLVQPARAGTVAAPTDRFTPPSDFDLFVMGRLQGETPGPGEEGGHELGVDKDAVQHLLDGQAAAGIEGPHGHIIE